MIARVFVRMFSLQMLLLVVFVCVSVLRYDLVCFLVVVIDVASAFLCMFLLLVRSLFSTVLFFMLSWLFCLSYCCLFLFALMCISVSLFFFVALFLLFSCLFAIVLVSALFSFLILSCFFYSCVCVSYSLCLSCLSLLLFLRLCLVLIWILKLPSSHFVCV